MNLRFIPSAIRDFFRALGPAFIVASVVLGPGSILSSSRVGAAYGFRMVWVVVLAGGLMIGMVAMAARLGVVLRGTMCDELAAGLGRPVAAVVGLTIFLICAGFQFGNNLGVLAALDLFFGSIESGDASNLGGQRLYPNLVLVALNLVILCFLFGFRRLYGPLELAMKVLVGLMIAGFVGNFVYLLCAGLGETVARTEAPSQPDVNLVAIVGLIGTTFSIAGAFYQAYLVREKGWGLDQLKQGLIDSAAGISVLALITMVIMLTAAISFHGQGVKLQNAADVARQLQPLFGRAALILFGLGIFAAALSSFLVNAMIGGAMLSDGLGLGGTLDAPWTKVFTTLALLIGLAVAMFVPADNRVGLIVFAQAMVVIGFPLLALSMLYLATRPDLTGRRRVPMWMKLVGVVGLLVVVGCAAVPATLVWNRLFTSS